MNIRSIKRIYFRIPIILKLLMIVLVTMIFFGMIIHFIEPVQFPTAFDGIWWAFVTAATVGYGDYVPLTTTGRIIGILLILTGGGLIAFYITSLSTATLKREQDLENGRLAFHGHDHFIFVGWNERTRQLMKLVLEYYPGRRIVVIDKTVNKLTYREYPVHFIQGDATEDDTIKKANIANANCVLITADITKNERQADTYSIMTTIAMRGNHLTLPIVTEILSKKQIENAIRAGATTIIRSNDFMSNLFFHELDHLMQATPFEDIDQLLVQQQFSHQKLPLDLEDETFSKVVNYFLHQGYLVIGLIREDAYTIHPKPDFIMEENDIVITITNW